MPLPQATELVPVVENKKRPPKSTFGDMYPLYWTKPVKGVLYALQL